MHARFTLCGLLVPLCLYPAGCGAPKADFSKIQRPTRATELDAYQVFEGQWNWQAELLNADEAHKNWSGTAEWHWTLDQRCLHGRLASRSGDTEFQSEGFWTWNPVERAYEWAMFNNWGYPQQGEASYNADTKTWTMTYSSVGLDGTTSRGRYEITVKNNDLLEWRMEEWADAMHMVKKMEMKGRYERRKA